MDRDPYIEQRVNTCVDRNPYIEQSVNTCVDRDPYIEQRVSTCVDRDPYIEHVKYIHICSKVKTIIREMWVDNRLVWPTNRLNHFSNKYVKLEQPSLLDSARYCLE